ncbi:MAG: RusA family crossover junction endodeoxyribonuclease [Xanthobacteraceae bacterium]
MSALPIVIEIAGEPKGKGRPRFTRGGHAYTPTITRNFEATLRLAAEQEMNGQPPIEGALAVVVTATFSIPLSWSKRKRAAALVGSLPHTKTPDVDNLLKVVDALNQICWLDDRQIVHAIVIKQYGERPSLKIEIMLRGQR